MVHHIKASDGSSQQVLTGDAFADDGPDFTLIVDVNAFLISENMGNGARLTGAWSVTINGQVTAFAGDAISLDSGAASTVTIGRFGDVTGSNNGITFNEAGTLINKGIISGNNRAVLHLVAADFSLNNSGLIQGGLFGFFAAGSTDIYTLVNSGTIVGITSSISCGGKTHITNFGTLDGDVSLFGQDDVFTDFKKVGKVVTSGTVIGVIDLGAGVDHFNGGAKGETLRDNTGADITKFGGGNDTYLAVKLGGGTDIDTDSVDGGRGSDRYDATGETSALFINLDVIDHLGHAAQTATGGSAAGTDTITGFENATGGSVQDVLFGSSAANSLSGGLGNDELFGFGGRDTLRGGAGADVYHFVKLSDSGTKATTRDVIIDFESHDTIDLSAIDANGNAPGDAFSYIGFANFSGHRGELRESFNKGNTIVSGDVNGDGKADFSILLPGHILLQETEFVL